MGFSKKDMDTLYLLASLGMEIPIRGFIHAIQPMSPKQETAALAGEFQENLAFLKHRSEEVQRMLEQRSE